MLLNILLVLEGHAVCIYKSEVRDARLDLLTERNRFWKALPKEIRQPVESVAPFLLDIGRSSIACEELFSRIGITRNQPGNPQGHPGMALKRFVFRAREKKAVENLSKGVDGQAGIAPS
jgi:hypothetical protein